MDSVSQTFCLFVWQSRFVTLPIKRFRILTASNDVLKSHCLVRRLALRKSDLEPVPVERGVGCRLFVSVGGSVKGRIEYVIEMYRSQPFDAGIEENADALFFRLRYLVQPAMRASYKIREAKEDLPRVR